ncbi:ROK family protein [Neptuniibacter sp. SY11_33]|uniref:ROK family protein n=1 Tax=Neptuniibacter sp. SY11_33 TaxID=3398215 RepID=UPI0039F58A59
MDYCIGIDLGGTKIEIIALTPSSDVLFRYRVPTPQGNYQATLDAICSLIERAENSIKNPPSSIGIGIPGAISRETGLIKNANSTCLIGHPLDKDLSERIQRPIQIANDADCFTLSEAIDGSGKDYSSVFGVILGTGVGGGIAINKQLLSGPNSICGEWGHNPLPRLDESDGIGRDCYCGKQDCIETFLSGPGFTTHYNHSTFSHLDTESIWELAKTGDKSAVDYCDLYIEQLAKALSSVINILDPAVIVLGGGLSNQSDIYQKLPERLAQYVFSDSMNTPILKAQYGDSSGVRGAAWL